MKIGVSSYSFSQYMNTTGASLIDVCDKAKELGFDGIEFTDLPGDAPLELAKTIRAHCDKIGLPIISYTVGANLLCDDLAAEIKNVKRKVDIAAVLGVKVMRHDAAFALKNIPGYTWEDGVRDMAPAIREITEYAAAKGIKTCSENHGFFYQASERVERLIQAVNHPNYGWLVDMGNFLCVDENSANAVRRAAKYAFHVHAKDFLYKMQDDVTIAPEGFWKNANGNYLRGTVVGHGVVPIPTCVRLLKEAGYDGWLSLEFEGHEQNIGALEQGLAYLRRVIA